jgi:hypothetical protein
VDIFEMFVKHKRLLISLQMAAGPSAQNSLNGNGITFKKKTEREYQHDFIKRPVLFCKLNPCLKIS